MNTASNPPASPWLPATVHRTLRERETTYAITGATGWLGRATLAALFEALGDDARVTAYASSAQDIMLGSGRTIRTAPIADLRSLRSEAPVTFLHYAFITKDRVADSSLDDYVRVNRDLDQAVIAAMENNTTAGLFLPSSGAVYGPGRSRQTDLAADPYGALKLEQEDRFAGLGIEAPLVIARVFNLSGPFINKHGAYALASIINDVLRGGPIVLKASNSVIRSYIHVADLIALVLADLTRGPARASVVRFDTAGEEEVELGDLARRAAAVLERPELPIERPAVRPEPVNRYVGDGGDMAARMLANGLAVRNLDTQIRDTAAFLANATA